MKFRNKTIWMYWHQGFENSNWVVKHCVRSWQLLNPGWDVKLLDSTSIQDYCGGIDIPEERLDNLIIQHRSDLVRTKLLIKYGGVWADPSCFCSLPLDEWLKSVEGDLFFFRDPGRDRIISNWFIAAPEPESPLLNNLYTALCSYWTKNVFRNTTSAGWLLSGLSKVLNKHIALSKYWFSWWVVKVFKVYPYLVYHYMFYLVLLKNDDLMKSWKKTTYMSALPAHMLLRYGLENPVSRKIADIIDAPASPVFKLRWQLDSEMAGGRNTAQYLFDSLT